ncbi:hypothetical protein MOVI109754_20780 [Moritella viscosa]
MLLGLHPTLSGLDATAITSSRFAGLVDVFGMSAIIV